jgi:hypothetical protein
MTPQSTAHQIAVGTTLNASIKPGNWKDWRHYDVAFVGLPFYMIRTTYRHRAPPVFPLLGMDHVIHSVDSCHRDKRISGTSG